MVDKTKAQADSLIKPQLEKLARKFQDACRDLRYGPKRPEWEATQLVEAAVGKYVDEQIKIVSESVSRAIQTTDTALTEGAIQDVFTGLIPHIDQTRTFVYQTLSGFGFPGTPGVGIELDNAHRLGIDLESANLKLLAKQSEAKTVRPGSPSKETQEEGMARQRAPESSQPTLSPDRAQKALTRQLADLEKLKSRSFADADSDETEWQHLTQSIIERAFGKPSSNLDKFYQAYNAGEHNLYGIDEQQQQSNYELRIKKYESLLRSLISELSLCLPEEEIKGVYQPGDEYEFYRDLSTLVAKAKQDVFIVDAYLDETVFNLYVEKVLAGVPVRILSSNISTNVETVAKMYARGKPLELHSSVTVHDRVVYLDQRGWVVGQSIKDAAKKKPTYMIELAEPMLTASRDAYGAIWSTARVIIRRTLKDARHPEPAP